MTLNVKLLIGCVCASMMFSGCSDPHSGEKAAAPVVAATEPVVEVPTQPKAPIIAHVPLAAGNFNDGENKQSHKAGLVKAARWVLTDPYCVEATSGYWDHLGAGDENPTGVPGDYYVITCRVSDLANANNMHDVWYVKSDGIGKAAPFRLQRSRNAAFYAMCSRSPKDALRVYGPEAVHNCKNDNLDH